MRASHVVTSLGIVIVAAVAWTVIADPTDPDPRLGTHASGIAPRKDPIPEHAAHAESTDAASTAILVPRGSARTPITASGVLVGTVTNGDGVPLPAGTVRLEVDGPDRRTILAAVAEDGAFALRGLVEGEYRVRSRADQHAPEEVSVLVRGGPTPARADFVLLAQRTIVVRLAAQDGSPLPDALRREGLDPLHVGRIEVWQEDRASQSRVADGHVVDRGASFAIAERTPARVRLVLGETVLDERGVEPALGLVELIVDVRRVRSRATWVVVELPEPVAVPAEVTVSSIDGFRRCIPFLPGSRTLQVPTPPGRLEIAVAVSGRANVHRETFVAPGSTEFVVVGALVPGHELRGRVVDATGRGVTRDLELWRDSDSASHEDRSDRGDRRSVRADVNGHFVVRGLRAGVWHVECAGERRSPSSVSSSAQIVVPRATPIVVSANP